VAPVEPGWVASLVDAGVLEPRGAGPEAWLFPASDVVRARAVARLLRDLDVNLEGAALILELVEERRRLERRIALLERLLENERAGGAVQACATAAERAAVSAPA